MRLAQVSMQSMSNKELGGLMRIPLARGPRHQGDSSKVPLCPQFEAIESAMALVGIYENGRCFCAVGWDFRAEKAEGFFCACRCVRDELAARLKLARGGAPTTKNWVDHLQLLYWERVGTYSFNDGVDVLDWAEQHLLVLEEFAGYSSQHVNCPVGPDLSKTYKR